MRNIVLLGQDCAATRAIYHALADRFGQPHVILERRLPRSALLRDRMRKLGLVTAAGQALFVGLAVPLLRHAGARRIAEIRQLYSLRTGTFTTRVTHVQSVNSSDARAALKQLDPKVVVVSGTRIISRETLEATNARFINLHAGITPQYRGVHGGYWALVEGRPDLVGTTIHLVDEGVDTGAILEQRTFQATREDSFATYPFLHAGVGLPALLDVVEQARTDTLQPSVGVRGDSRIHYHPTLWGYVGTRLRTGVR